MDANVQIVLTVGVPTLAVLLGSLINNSRMSDLRAYMDSRFTALERVMDARFQESAANLRRVEEVMDARLTRIEQELKIR
ncbi:MAG: hypothetical protein ACLP59_33510 [Bryobacteraceae bacterium]